MHAFDAWCFCVSVHSTSLLFRCAPDPIAFAQNELMDSQRTNATKSFYKIFGLDDLFRKVLSDFYISWKEIIVLCIVAVGESVK